MPPTGTECVLQLKKRGQRKLHGGSRDNKVLLQFAFRPEIVDGFINQSIGAGGQFAGGDLSLAVFIMRDGSRCLSSALFPLQQNCLGIIGMIPAFSLRIARSLIAALCLEFFGNKQWLFRGKQRFRRPFQRRDAPCSFAGLWDTVQAGALNVDFYRILFEEKCLFHPGGSFHGNEAETERPLGRARFSAFIRYIRGYGVPIGNIFILAQPLIDFRRECK